MKLFHDARGWSGEIWRCPTGRDAYRTDYWARSRERTLRGLHFRDPPQHGLLTVIRGRIFDVMVDLRTGKWSGVNLNEGEQIMVPMGVAHGYCVVSEWADVIYKLSEYWVPVFEHGIAWNDPRLAIAWPIDNPFLSERDTKWPTFSSLAA